MTPSKQPTAPGSDVAGVLNLATDRTSPKRRWMVVVVLIATVLTAIAIWKGSRNRVRYETALARRAELIVSVDATGTIEPTNQVQVGSEISGIVQEVFADYNDTVEAGAVLAKLDTEPLLAQVRSSRASLLAAQAALKEAEVVEADRKNELERLSELLKRQLLSQQAYDSGRFAALRAESAVESARAQVEVRRAALSADQTRLTKAEVRSPISGVVIARSVEAGQTVAASFQTPVLFTLAEDLTRMELHLDIDEADVGRIALGQEASFTVDAFPERVFPAQIASVRLAPQTIQGVVTYEALLSVDNSDGALRPGMTATAKVVTDRRGTVLQIPNAALRFAPADPPEKDPEAGGDYVWCLSDETLIRKEITTGLSDGSWTEVLGGDIDLESNLVVDVETPE